MAKKIHSLLSVGMLLLTLTAYNLTKIQPRPKITIEQDTLAVICNHWLGVVNANDKKCPNCLWHLL